MTWLLPYLSSGVVKGIGPKTAERICKQLGDNALTLICNDPSGTANTCGISLNKALALQSAMALRADSEDVLELLMGNGISKYIANKIIEHYGKRAKSVVEEDPYRMAREVYGIGFVTADKIAQKLSFSKDCIQRIKGGLHYTLELATVEGHCYLTQSQLFDKARQLLNVPFGPIDDALIELIANNEVAQVGDNYYQYRIFNAVKIISQFVHDRHRTTLSKSIPSELIKQCLESYERDKGISLTDEQVRAVHAAYQSDLNIVTGGPGCGKTTIIKAISMIAHSAGLRLALTAPTGRAAQRMGEVCGMDAFTIHRLLRFDPHSNRFMFNAQCPLPYDMIIVDETSMLDVVIARALFTAIRMDAIVVLVGDKDQLPSVGPGRVFADIIDTGMAKTTILNKVFRQQKGSEISRIAIDINAGTMPDISQEGGEAIFIPRNTSASLVATICALVKRTIPDDYGYQLSDTIVLTASNGGDIGTAALNQRLQAELNPSGDELVYQDTIFRVGDRVCHRKNNYFIHRNGVFNGDMGTVIEVDRKNMELAVQLWDNRIIKYTAKWLNQLSLAYATTVHRAQGSEMPCVILAIQDYQYPLLEKRLIYTAVTRAKKQLFIVGSRKALAIGIGRLVERNAGLMVPAENG